MKRCGLLAAGVLLWAVGAQAETGAEAWLRYAPLLHRTQYAALPARIVVEDRSDRLAAEELRQGLTSMLGRPFRVVAEGASGAALRVGRDASLGAEEYRVVAGHSGVRISGGSARAALYGVFHVLEEVAAETPLPADERQRPAVAVRWVNQWDNLDGLIERGYAGRSIFFAGGHVRADLTRAGAYARLLASVGINGCTVNNVNSDLRTLTPGMLQEFARIAEVFRPWGVRLSLSVDLSSPQVAGGLKTFDPLDPAVALWWQQKVDEVYKRIPDFAGFVVKADSEGRAGPSQYDRTPAEAANVLARALKPHGGLVLYRGFVYNHHLDWHDMKADRARAGYDNFASLDGKFEPNVVVQIKHGPIDFQVREPVSPLFTGLRHPSEAIELQVTQEYTGQQRHMVYLVPMWKTALDTDMRVDGRASPLREVVEGRTFHQPLGGFVGVANVGLEENWLHHPMALLNLYGFGRLAWDPRLTSSQIAEEWTRQTFGNEPRVVGTIDALQMGSWKAYEHYTGPLGLGTLTDIIGVHFGPGIESAENNGWGQWIRADHAGVGMDRTSATGTGYISQYPAELAAEYESLKTCPEALLLFLHHVPYGYRLRSGQTLIQYVYDAHYAGAATAAGYAARWKALKGLVDEARYAEVLGLFEFQAGHAAVWRDAVNQWFARESGVEDEQHRVGHDANRIEAEAMTADGYTVVPGEPWETASGGKAVVCPREVCSLSTKVARAGGSYRVDVQYFDLRNGVSNFELQVNGRTVAGWKAEDTLPPAVEDKRVGGQTSTRFTLPRVELKTGDTLTIVGRPDGQERAPVDYVELTPLP